MKKQNKKQTKTKQIQTTCKQFFNKKWLNTKYMTILVSKVMKNKHYSREVLAVVNALAKEITNEILDNKYFLIENCLELRYKEVQPIRFTNPKTKKVEVSELRYKIYAKLNNRFKKFLVSAIDKDMTFAIFYRKDE